MSKFRFFIIILAALAAFSAYANGADEGDMDAMTTASIVKDPDAFAAALSADGTWIAAALNDITIDGDLIVEGEFLDDGEPYRKLALYTQDEDRNVTATFTLKADKLIVRSVHTRIQNGTFVGDVYVEAKDFELRGATVDGNVYFADEELKETFMMDESSSVTGTVGLQM